jgi:glycosyltransferase involved in cell wall biosynthesis
MNYPMNILMSCHYIGNVNAGAMGVTWRLVQEYERLGHTAKYFSLDSMLDWLHPLAKVVIFPEYVATRAWKEERSRRLDVVDASTGDGWVWSLLRRGADRPVTIARCHGLEHIEHEEYLKEAQLGNLELSWKYWLYRGSIRLWEAAQSMRSADLALFLNQRDRVYAIERLGVQPDRAHIAANGISQSFLNRPLDPLPADGTLRIAQVGTYIIRKGVHYGSPALNEILLCYPQVSVTFLGTECAEEKVYADFSPEVRDRVLVIPRYPNDALPELLRGHHIKLFPTISEGFGIALIEAMACGLVPITTNTPGPLEIVREDHDALVVPCRDSEALVQAMERLIGDRPFLEQLRRNAYETAQRYSWSRIAQDNLTYYEKARFFRELR